METGYIYKMVVDNIDDIYIGSTTHLGNRKSLHKNNCYDCNNKAYNINLYKIIRNKYNIIKDDFYKRIKFICLCKVDYNERWELTNIEAKYIKELNTIGNTNMPFDKPIIEVIKEYQKQYYKQYRIDNKDKISKYKKEYYKDNEDKISEYQKSYQKQYNKSNKDKLKEYQKEYRGDNKDKRSEYQKQYHKSNKSKKYCLFCKSWVRKKPSRYNKHIKCKKHLKNLIKYIDEVKCKKIELTNIN